MKRILLALAVAVPAIVSAQQPLTTDSISYSDGAYNGNATVKLGGQFPTGDNSSLVHSTRAFIADMFAPEGQRVTFASGREMLRGISRAWLKECDWLDGEPVSEYGPKASLEGWFGVTYQTDKVVTVRVMAYDYQGGAHGMPMDVSKSFRVSDGKALSAADIFKKASYSQVIALIRRAVAKQYFDGASIASLSNSGINLKQATMAPVVAFTAKGMKFLYGPYELGPYSAGMPECVIPYSQLRAYMTLAALELLPASAASPAKKKGTAARTRRR